MAAKGMERLENISKIPNHNGRELIATPGFRSAHHSVGDRNKKLQASKEVNKKNYTIHLWKCIIIIYTWNLKHPL